MVSVRAALPRALVTVISTSVRPARAIAPVMTPVFASSVRPAGRLRAANVSGASPVAGMRKMNGRPGVPPVMRGGLMRGAAGQPDAIGGAGSDGNVQLSGFSVAPAFRKISPPAQSALSPVLTSLPSSISSSRKRAPVQIDVHFQRRAAHMQHVADEHLLVVEPDFDGDRSLPARVVVEADHREEARGLAFEIDDELVDRERADAVRVGDAAERDGWRLAARPHRQRRARPVRRRATGPRAASGGAAPSSRGRGCRSRSRWAARRCRAASRVPAARARRRRPQPSSRRSAPEVRYQRSFACVLPKKPYTCSFLDGAMSRPNTSPSDDSSSVFRRVSFVRRRAKSDPVPARESKSSCFTRRSVNNSAGSRSSRAPTP